MALTLLAFEEKRWAHGDVKCNNMMKSGDDLYLIDFGLFQRGLSEKNAKLRAQANMAYFLLEIFRRENVPVFRRATHLKRELQKLAQALKSKHAREKKKRYLLPYAFISYPIPFVETPEMGNCTPTKNIRGML